MTNNTFRFHTDKQLSLWIKSAAKSLRGSLAEEPVLKALWVEACQEMKSR